MNERQHTTTRHGAGTGLDPWEGVETERNARVAHGLHQESLPIVGLTVRQVRSLFGARLDIGPASEAFLDGEPAGEDTVVRAGQILSFTHHAGEKGILRQGELDYGTPPVVASVTIEGRMARARSPEGVSSTLPWPTLLQRIAPPLADTGDLVLPDGVRAVSRMRGGVIVVHQSPPQVVNLRWIDPASPRRYGPGTQYRRVRVALPYLVVLATFSQDDSGRLRLDKANEAFFTNRPLASLDDPLHYPALLNCSRFEPQDGRPLSWICTQHLKKGVPPNGADDNARVRWGLAALLRHLLETGFNESSEHHEHSSWFAETVAAGIDERLASVESWEAATAADPLFVLEVPWLPTGKSAREVVERIRTYSKRSLPPVAGADELARFIFNDDEPDES